MKDAVSFCPDKLPAGWTEACDWAKGYCRQMFNKEWHDDSIAAEYMAARNGYLAAFERHAHGTGCSATWQPIVNGPIIPCTLPAGHAGKHRAPSI